MKALIIGKSGQLASELVAEVPKGIEISSVGRRDIDITSYEELSALVEKNRFTVLINASAYTAVDKAEAEREAAYLLNKTAVEIMSNVAKENNIRLLHVSTDFVFDGKSNTSYSVLSKAAPTGVYGASKLAGENAIKNIYPKNSSIIRTSWVYSSFGNNFVKTMLALMLKKEEIGVVSDQIGCPTYAKSLAAFLWKLVDTKNLLPMYHWSDAGVASWYDFALAIQNIGVEEGLLKKKISIRPIPSSAYSTKAKRPCFSLLNISESSKILSPVHWQEQLRECMKLMKQMKL